MAKESIKVYGTSWCPDCARAKTVFSKLGTPFSWYDIERDKEARAYVEEVNRGNRSVPTIVFPDGSILVEPSNTTLEKKIKEFE